LIQQIILYTARTFEVVLLMRIVLSWFFMGRAVPNGGGVAGQIIGLLYIVTEPVLNPIRKLIIKSPIKSIMRYLDFSPIVALALVRGIAALLIRIVQIF